ncbi:Sad1 and UNC84 domain containing 2, partial [Caligus rogercresseyi]
EIRDSVQQLQERMLSNKASLEGQFTSLREQFTELQSLKEETHRLELEAFERKLSELNDKLGSVKDLLLRSEGIVHKCEATVKTISAQTNISIRDYVEDLIHDNSSELSMHLQKHFVSQKDMSVLVNDMKTQLKVEEELLPGHRHSLSQQNHVTSLVEAALVKYDADKTGMFDFALESAGGTIISTRCTETYDDAWAVHSILGIPFWWERNNPRTILNPSSNPGECWAFKGSQGSVVVGLSQPVKVEAFSLEHISKMMAPDRKIPSAPRRFTVLGLSSLSDESPFVFGNFTYDDNGSPVQTFIVPAYLPPVKLVELKVLSNYGHLVYTCVYRIRVHGAFAGPENNLS